MEFEDFCRYFTDLVVCRLVEHPLLWPWGHWREVSCLGEWTHAPAGPTSTISTATQPSKSHETFSGSQWSHPASVPALRGDRKEERLGERQLDRRKVQAPKEKKKEEKALPIQGRETTKKKKGEKFEVKEVEEDWERERDKRSRCGGCINHRETFLHNPQVRRLA